MPRGMCVSVNRACAIVGVCAHVHAVHLHVLVWEVSLSSLSAANLLSTPGS